MSKPTRCKLDLHYWRYNPEGKLRFCEACGLEQYRTRNLFFNRWMVKHPHRKVKQGLMAVNHRYISTHS